MIHWLWFHSLSRFLSHKKKRQLFPRSFRFIPILRIGSRRDDGLLCSCICRMEKHLFSAYSTNTASFKVVTTLERKQVNKWRNANALNSDCVCYLANAPPFTFRTVFSSTRFLSLHWYSHPTNYRILLSKLSLERNQWTARDLPTSIVYQRNLYCCRFCPNREFLCKKIKESKFKIFRIWIRDSV